MDKENTTHRHTHIHACMQKQEHYSALKEEGHSIINCIKDGLCRQSAKWNKSVTGGQILHEFIFMRYLE